MKAVLSVCLGAWILFAAVADARAVSLGILAHDMKLVRSKGRVSKHPDGWLFVIVAQGEVAEGEFTLPERLQPGRYTFFLEVDNRSKSVIRLSCGGGASAESIPEDRDWNALWSDPIPLELKVPAETLTFTMTTADDPTGRKTRDWASRALAILQAVYITDRPDVVVDRNACVIRRGPPAAKDYSPPHAQAYER